MSANKINHAIYRIVIHPVDSVIHLFNNPGLMYWTLFVQHGLKTQNFTMNVKAHERFRHPDILQYFLEYYTQKAKHLTIYYM